MGADCTVTLMPAPPLDFQITTPDQNLLASEVITQGISADFEIVQVATDPADITPTDGFSFAYGHDPSLLTIDSVDLGAGLASLDGGAGPEFFQGSLFPAGAAVGCLYERGQESPYERITFQRVKLVPPHRPAPSAVR